MSGTSSALTSKGIALAQASPRLPRPLILQLPRTQADWQHAHHPQAQLQRERLARALQQRGEGAAVVGLTLQLLVQWFGAAGAEQVVLSASELHT